MKSIMEKINENAGIIGIVVTIITLVASFIFKLGSYLYEVGWNHYFRIDNRFIDIDFEYNLMNLLFYIAFSIVILFFSYFEYKDTLKKKGVILKKLRRFIILVLINYIILFVRVGIRGGINVVAFILLSSICSYFLIGFLGEKIYKMINDKEEEQELESKWKKWAVIMLILIVFRGYFDAAEKEKFDYLEVNNQQYVVLDIYNDLYYTYPCKINEGKMTADSSIRRMFAMDEVVTQKGNFTLEIK